MNKVLKGDALTVLKTLPSESINCTVTSPPYWGLRDYGTEPIIWDGNPNCEHEWVEHIKKPIGGKGSKGANVGANKNDFSNMRDHNVVTNFCKKCGAWKGSLGLEPTFELYIKHLCDIFDETKRVLRNDGTCWVNLGDSYSTVSGSIGKGKWEQPKYKSCDSQMPEKIKTELPSKSLTLIPFRFAIEMVNRGWILRNVIIWHKPNCMPSSAKDRFTVDFEYLFFFVKNKKYWFEQQFEPHLSPVTNKIVGRKGTDVQQSQGDPNGFHAYGEQGRNKRTVWTIPTKPYPEAHFAVYPAELIRTCIKAGCPRYVCKKCGKAREKVYDTKINPDKVPDKWKKTYRGKVELNGSPTKRSVSELYAESLAKEKIFQGYSDCGCNAGFRPGVVLDPFAGSGTTLEEAIRQGKDYIGIELKDDYIDLINKRLSKVQVSLI